MTATRIALVPDASGGWKRPDCGCVTLLWVDRDSPQGVQVEGLEIEPCEAHAPKESRSRSERDAAIARAEKAEAELLALETDLEESRVDILRIRAGMDQAEAHDEVQDKRIEQLNGALVEERDTALERAEKAEADAKRLREALRSLMFGASHATKEQILDGMRAALEAKP